MWWEWEQEYTATRRTEGEYGMKQLESNNWSQLKTQGNGNSQKSLRVTPSNEGYGAWTSLYPGNISSGGLETSTQSQNFWSTLFPAYKRCWGKSCAETVGVTNQWLVQLETHAMKGSTSPILPKGPRTRAWIAQRPVIEPYTNCKKRKVIKWFLIIICCTHSLVSSLIIIRSIQPATDGNRYRHWQSNTRWSSGDPVEDREEELLEPKDSRTPPENPGDQITWAHRDWTDNQRAYMGLT